MKIHSNYFVFLILVFLFICGSSYGDDSVQKVDAQKLENVLEHTYREFQNGYHLVSVHSDGKIALAFNTMHDRIEVTEPNYPNSLQTFSVDEQGLITKISENGAGCVYELHYINSSSLVALKNRLPGCKWLESASLVYDKRNKLVGYSSEGLNYRLPVKYVDDVVPNKSVSVQVNLDWATAGKIRASAEFSSIDTEQRNNTSTMSFDLKTNGDQLITNYTTPEHTYSTNSIEPRTTTISATGEMQSHELIYDEYNNPIVEIFYEPDGSVLFRTEFKYKRNTTPVANLGLLLNSPLFLIHRITNTSYQAGLDK